jgi:hypothetical protein
MKVEEVKLPRRHRVGGAGDSSIIIRPILEAELNVFGCPIGCYALLHSVTTADVDNGDPDPVSGQMKGPGERGKLVEDVDAGWTSGRFAGMRTLFLVLLAVIVYC